MYARSKECRSTSALLEVNGKTTITSPAFDADRFVTARASRWPIGHCVWPEFPCVIKTEAPRVRRGGSRGRASPADPAPGPAYGSSRPSFVRPARQRAARDRRTSDRPPARGGRAMKLPRRRCPARKIRVARLTPLERPGRQVRGHLSSDLDVRLEDAFRDRRGTDVTSACHGRDVVLVQRDSPPHGSSCAVLGRYEKRAGPGFCHWSLASCVMVAERRQALQELWMRRDHSFGAT